MKKRVVCYGPGPIFKGGISHYNTSLARALERLGAEVFIVSWTQQYPAIVPRDFLDKTSKTDLLEGTQIRLYYATNYNNPFSWHRTYRLLRSLQPDIVIFQWAIALQGLPLGYIARMLTQHTGIEVVFDLHVVRQKEASRLDNLFVKYGLRNAHTYIAHAYQTATELQALFPDTVFEINETGTRSDRHKTIVKLYHPVYDMFKPLPDFDREAFKRQLGLRKHVFLFFGFIRKYKGLHLLLPAFAELCKRRDDVSLLIAGESFWHTLNQKKISTRIKKTLFRAAKKLFLHHADDEQEYNPLSLIEELGLNNRVVVVNRFIAHEEVHQFFQAADCVVNFYLTATPSGVESIAYNFHKPILATRVGHFPETIIPGYNGYLAEPNDIQSMADTMEYFLDHPIDPKNVEAVAAKLSWDNYARAVLQSA